MRVAEALRELFRDKSRKVIFVPEVLECLQERLVGHYVEAIELKRIIGGLCNIIPAWLQIVTTSRGNVVRMENKDTLQISEIKKRIREHFEKRS